MEQRKNFFEQLDGGWGDIIADTYRDENEYKTLFIANVNGEIFKLSILLKYYKSLINQLIVESLYQASFNNYFIKLNIPDIYLENCKLEGFLKQPKNLKLCLLVGRRDLELYYECNLLIDKRFNEEYRSFLFNSRYNVQLKDAENYNNINLLYTDKDLTIKILDEAIKNIKNNKYINVDINNIIIEQKNLLKIINIFNQKYEELTLQ